MEAVWLAVWPLLPAVELFKEGLEADVILGLEFWLLALVYELPDLVVRVLSEFEVRLPVDVLPVLESDCVE